MIGYARNLLKNTTVHKRFWENRKIDWNQAYLQTWNHPHRYLISAVLKQIEWQSLLEVGCGPGPNLVNITKLFPQVVLGGIDVNPDAIELAKKTFKGVLFRVGSAENIMVSDDGTDVVLTDMCLIYVDPRKINKVIKEIKRVVRKYVVFCEFHSESWYDRMKIRLTSGYHAHNYVKLLKKHGFYDIQLIKIPPEAWPGGGLQGSNGYVILATVPRRK